VADQDDVTIKCASDGPYLVGNLNDLRNSRGEPVQSKAKIALCRCGGSANKPFCDGTHKRNGFTGKRTAEKPPTGDSDVYEGKQISILDNRSVCSHAGMCTDGLSTVWKLGGEPWIDPNGAPREEIATVVARCPSGALTYIVGEQQYSPDEATPSVVVSKDGPYLVKGSIPLTDDTTEQTPQCEDRYALCRCGQSKNKPFCDGSHWAAKFSDPDN